ncbi:DUF6491 family protein [Thermomonas aquatica]|uniref:Lipoprotein n=1 Tax=Thermomonas aquatica TaxID=2202149 RepID=A0A5B7ZTQ4_9GAMM|nr:DUF6491 family protein [Thermomonas aquatica]QDA58025.1 hypothetical protein FHQ07_12255 [Thermomonas aquatica]
MKALIIPMLAVLGLGACATNRASDADRLAMYQAHSGAPVKQIRFYNAMGWDRIDDEHVLLSMRPKETWLMKVSGPCLDWGSASPVLRLSSTGPYVMAKLDRILTDGSPVSCRIEEIRPVDVQAVRATEAALRAQASEGT